MTKPIPDKAEVALEYPDKLYIGTFERTARFDAHLDDAGISLSLHRLGGEDTRKSVRMHFHYALFAEILQDLAKTVAAMPLSDAAHRDMLVRRQRSLDRTDGLNKGEFLAHRNVHRSEDETANPTIEGTG